MKRVLLLLSLLPFVALAQAPAPATPAPAPARPAPSSPAAAKPATAGAPALTAAQQAQVQKQDAEMGAAAVRVAQLVDANRAQKYACAASAVVSLPRPASTTAIAAAAKNGKVSRKLAWARCRRPANALSGRAWPSRAEAFHFRPRSRVTTVEVAKM